MHDHVLSAQQKQAWRTWAPGLRSAVQVVLSIDVPPAGSLDPRALRRACAAVIVRENVLRTTLASEVETANDVQGARDRMSSADGFSVCDLTSISSDERAAWRRRCVERLRSGFASQLPAPPMQMVLMVFAATHGDLVLTASPFTADARTLELCGEEVLRGEPRTTDDRLSYARIVAWQRELLTDEDAEEGRAYWREQMMSADTDASPLPFERDVPRGASTSADRARSCALNLSPAGVASDAADRIGCSTSAFWLACWYAFLGRLSDEPPALIGVTFDGRQYAELARVIGPLDRTAPVPFPRRARRGDAETVAAIAAAVDDRLRDHADWLDHLPDLDAGPLDAGPLDAGPLEASSMPWRVGFADMRWSPPRRDGRIAVHVSDACVDRTGARLSLVVHEHEDNCRVRLHYDAERFAAGDVRRLSRWLMTFVVDAAARPDARSSRLRLLTRAERAQVVHAWNATTADEPQAPVHALFEARAASRPDAVAIVAEDAHLTYDGLNRRADRLAQALRVRGLGHEPLIGVCLDRSPDLIVALLGIAKTGGAYVPLEVDAPAPRLRFTIEDAGIAVVITRADLRQRLPIPDGVAVMPMDAVDADIAARPAVDAVDAVDVGGSERLAYVIYTSGSTGAPKGVAISHRALGNHMRWICDALALTNADCLLHKTPIGFDASVWELWAPLVTGGRLVMAAAHGHRDPAYLCQAMAIQGVTVLQVVPSLLGMLVEEPALRHCEALRVLCCGGEALTPSLRERALERTPARLVNLYGPTEVTIDALFWTCARGVAEDVVPIGRPVANTQAYVLDAVGEPAPPGISGELHLGGLGVARGYVRQPALTAERFVPDPFGAAGARLYRTGDRARRRADGALEFLGRVDHQVKLRGHRIELGEIEAALRQQADVRDAVVLLREDAPGERRLVAYVVPADPAAPLTVESIRQSLHARLTDAMVPAVFVTLPALPLTPSGKVDRRQLPAPGGDRPAPGTPYAAPSTAAEADLARIWAEVLRLPQVGIHDNFFALGGDSILSLQIVARALQAGWRLAPRQVFEHVTVAALAAVATPTAGLAPDEGAIAGSVALTPIQKRFFELHDEWLDHYNQAVRVEIEPRALRVLEDAWATLLERHDALRGRFVRGPDGWTQTILPVDAASRVASIDLRRVPIDVLARLQNRVAAAVQASLSLRDGPLARAVLCLAPSAAPALLLAIHHLVVDGVSWRILLDDLETICRLLDARRPVILPPKSSSVRRWADALHALASNDRLANELPVWQRASAPAATLPRVRASDRHIVRASDLLRVSASRETTTAVLQELPARGVSHVQECLLAALVQALAEWTGEDAWRIDLEGHGRDALDGVDVSRTVGWFTTIYPVRLTAGADPVHTLRLVKAALRAVPRHGLGYGVLRYLDARPSAAVIRTAVRSEIVFNYLGQADRVLAPEGWLQPSNGPLGPLVHRDGRREYLLEINALAMHGRLHVQWTSSRGHHGADAIARLADGYVRALEALVWHARHAPDPAPAVPAGFVATDFIHAAIDDGDLERIRRMIS